MANTKLKSVVAQQLPEFVREDYEAFTAFVQAYYDYLDQSEQRNLTDVKDIDRTIDSFISNFKSELNIFGETNYAHYDNVRLMRKIKEVYTAKGSESAYKFLFKILFNKTAEISYPWDQVLKPSDGKWKQETSIFVTVTSGDPTTLPGNRITITSVNAKIKAYVERVQFIRDNIYEIFIDKNYYGTIAIGDTVAFNSIAGTIIPTINKYEIINKGADYKIGDIIVSSTLVGSQTIQILFKVTGVDLDGGITKLSIIKYGAGYPDDFFVLTAKTNFSNSSTFVLSKDTVQQFSLPDDSSLDKYQDYGYITDPNYWDVSMSNTGYAGTLLREFFTETTNNQGDVQFALIRFNIGAVARYQGYYTTNDGFLDDAVKIQDSYYYQKYSYLITIDERLEDYSTILKSYIHSAGLKLFGEYQIQSEYAPGISCGLILDEYVSKATFRTINKAITNEFVSVESVGGVVRIAPYDSQGYMQADYNPNTYQPFDDDLITAYTAKDSHNNT